MTDKDIPQWSTSWSSGCDYILGHRSVMNTHSSGKLLFVYRRCHLHDSSYSSYIVYSWWSLYTDFSVTHQMLYFHCFAFSLVFHLGIIYVIIFIDSFIRDSFIFCCLYMRKKFPFTHVNVKWNYRTNKQNNQYRC